MISSKIVGNGLIASSFGGVFFKRKTLILAAGVSNSQEVLQFEFQREEQLIQREIANHPDYHVVYFSTCSIDCDVSSAYILHKQRMERLVQNSALSFHLFRLPQLVGVVKNATLISYLVDAILNQQTLNIHGLATRNLLDVIDLVRIVETLVNQDLGINSITNIASAKNVSVVEITREISALLQRSPKLIINPTGYSQNINIEFLKKALGSQDVLFDDDYWARVLRRYVSSSGLA
jgi:nucleoside-diphosphate-sugar epimerase